MHRMLISVRCAFSGGERPRCLQGAQLRLHAGDVRPVLSNHHNVLLQSTALHPSAMEHPALRLRYPLHIEHNRMQQRDPFTAAQLQAFSTATCLICRLRLSSSFRGIALLTGCTAVLAGDGDNRRRRAS